MGMTPEKWSVSALAVEFAMDRRTVARRLAEVPAADVTALGNVYWMRDAAPALVQGAASSSSGTVGEKLNLTDETARLKKMQADKAGLELEVMRAKLIPAETVAKVWAAMLVACRQKMLSLPSTIATRVFGLPVRDIQAEAETLVYNALTELKDYDAADYVSDVHLASVQGGDEPARAAPEAPGERVGRPAPTAVKRGKRRARPVED
jgi:phage terminase Nu1 subunit (DNA packaging protein)